MSEIGIPWWQKCFDCCISTEVENMPKTPTLPSTTAPADPPRLVLDARRGNRLASTEMVGIDAILHMTDEQFGDYNRNRSSQITGRKVVKEKRARSPTPFPKG